MQSIMHYCGLFLALVCLAFNEAKSSTITHRVETNFVTVRRNFEWAIESSPQLNLTQYLMEKGPLESPVFDLQDSANSRGVLRMVHLRGSHQVERYFRLSQGGPLKKVYYRVSLVNQLLKSKDLQANGYSQMLPMGWSLGQFPASRKTLWTFEDLTNTDRGFVKDGVVIFKVELDFLERNIEQESVGQETSQQQRTNTGGGAESGGKVGSSSSGTTEVRTSYRVFEWEVKMSPNFEFSRNLEFRNSLYFRSPILLLGDSNNTTLAIALHDPGTEHCGDPYVMECLNVHQWVEISGAVPNANYRLTLVNQLLIAEDISESGLIKITEGYTAFQDQTHQKEWFWNPKFGFFVHGQLFYRLEISFFDGIKNSRHHAGTTASDELIGPD